VDDPCIPGGCSTSNRAVRHSICVQLQYFYENKPYIPDLVPFLTSPYEDPFRLPTTRVGRKIVHSKSQKILPFSFTLSLTDGVQRTTPHRRRFDPHAIASMLLVVEKAEEQCFIYDASYQVHWRFPGDCQSTKVQGRVIVLLLEVPNEVLDPSSLLPRDFLIPESTLVVIPVYSQVTILCAVSTVSVVQVQCKRKSA
jgi:hypothetical protein